LVACALRKCKKNIEKYLRTLRLTLAETATGVEGERFVGAGRGWRESMDQPMFGYKKQGQHRVMPPSVRRTS